MEIETFGDFKVRKRGCVLMDVDVPGWDEICSMIDHDDVYLPGDPEHGIEDEPHVTVLYGFYSFVTTEDVTGILQEFEPPIIRFGNIGIFQDHPDFDVVMVTVESNDLAKMNTALSRLPNEETYPNYKPHVTIAYVHKGTAKKYEGMQVDFPEELTLTKAEYSRPNGQNTLIKLHER
jgi:hypothetical protein